MYESLCKDLVDNKICHLLADLPSGAWSAGADTACKRIGELLREGKRAYVAAAGLASGEMRSMLLTLGNNVGSSRQLDLRKAFPNFLSAPTGLLILPGHGSDRDSADS